MENKKYKSGLAVMRAQPPHIGHEKLIRRMLSECEKITIILGSVQEQGTARNPYSYTQRKAMLLSIFTPEEQAKMKVLGIFDINNPTEWSSFVLDFIKESMPEIIRPDVYYAGSDYDAQWFRKDFDNIVIDNRVDYDFPYVSGSMVRDMITIGDQRWHNFVPQAIHAKIEELSSPKKGVL